MHTTRRASGLTLHVPDTVVASGAPPARARAFTPATAEDRVPDLLAALEGSRFTVIDEVELTAALPVESRPRPRSAAPAPGGVARIDVPLAEGEGAVLLVDDQGMLSWKLPEAAPQAGRAHFTIAAPAAGGGARPRGFFSDAVSAAVRVHALTFVAQAATGAAVTLMERGVRRGLVAMRGADPAQWRPFVPGAAAWPRDRPARVLVWVHGTFSSTAGSFGALCGTAPGRALLEAAAVSYDAVVGLDHATLSDDPVANAGELRRAIDTLGCAGPVRLDLVAFSRGGLVSRVFLDQLRRASLPGTTVDRAIYVACANAGTALANPENWGTLIDLYTNIAVGAGRLLALSGPAAPAGLMLAGAAQGIGTLVKVLATGATTDVPGLAAMRPGCDFLSGLCGTAADEPDAASAASYAVTAEFRPELAAVTHLPGELPRRLVMALADGFVDRLMDEPNDLVVNTASMTAVRGGARHALRDTLALGTTPHVYHTSYFTRGEVIGALAGWLQLPLHRAQEVTT